MTTPGGFPNEFEKAARQEDEARKKAEAAAARAKLEQEQDEARQKQFIDLLARFHAQAVLPQLEAFARAQNVRFTKPSLDPPREGQVPQFQSQVQMFPARTPELSVSVLTLLGGGGTVTGFFRGKDTVFIQVRAHFKAGVLKSVLGLGQIYDKSAHFVLGDFSPEKRAKVEDWVKQRLVEVSGKCAEAFARANG
jgi:hypothetical protein